jgi:uncharacterized membrane protein
MPKPNMPITALSLSILTTFALPGWFSWDPLLPYFTAVFLFTLGVSIAIRNAPAQASVLDKIILCGPVFLAMPMAVFGTQHFLFPIGVGRIIPSWIPAHTFWVYLVGTCLILGGLSIVFQKFAWLSAGFFGIMLLLFEALLHIPQVMAAPHNNLAWEIALRDLSFSCGALSFAAMQMGEWRIKNTRWVISATRTLVGIVLMVFAVQYFLHPQLLPGVPLKQLTPSFVPGHLLWGYPTSAVYAVAAVCMLMNRSVHLAATSVGLFVLLSTIMFCVPIMVQNGSNIGAGLNVVVDTLLLSGAMLCMAGRCAQPEE